MIDCLSLKNLKIDEYKILQFGFKKQDGSFVFNKKIVGDEFILNILIQDNIISSSVVEVANNERFALYDVVGQTGAYVGQMHKEYDDIINLVKQKCCTQFVFKTNYAQKILSYIKNKYGDEIEFLWTKLPECAIARNKTNKKWYLAISSVNKKSIGILEQGKIEIICFLMQPDKLEKLVDNKIYLKGYHMNKKYWMTVKLDESVDIQQIYDFIDNSYILSMSKK